MSKGSRKMKRAAIIAHETEKRALLFTKYKLGNLAGDVLIFNLREGMDERVS
jgi:hypothetical protein